MRIEIRAAEGGDDAKLLVLEMCRLYRRAAQRLSFPLEVVSELPGLLVLRTSGRAAAGFFSGEGGGHRWQRVPPTERRGRVQTSTVTVAVLPEGRSEASRVRASDVTMEVFRSGGPGGQHQNKTSSGVRLRHVPTGTVVESREERDQYKNGRRAMEKLEEALETAAREAAFSEEAGNRRSQVGSGMRGDKIRTYRVRDDRVTDHRTGLQTSLTKIERGDWSDIK